MTNVSKCGTHHSTKFSPPLSLPPSTPPPPPSPSHYSQHILCSLFPFIPSQKIFSPTKMAADSADKRPIRALGTTASHPAPKIIDPLPCPRCESNSTKFCKSCRRYWTHGRTLQNVPVGGGTRKTSKSTRPCSVSAPSPVSTTSSSAPTPRCVFRSCSHTPISFSSPSSLDSNQASIAAESRRLLKQ